MATLTKGWLHVRLRSKHHSSQLPLHESYLTVQVRKLGHTPVAHATGLWTHTAGPEPASQSLCFLPSHGVTGGLGGQEDDKSVACACGLKWWGSPLGPPQDLPLGQSSRQAHQRLISRIFPVAAEWLQSNTLLSIPLPGERKACFCGWCHVSCTAMPPSGPSHSHQGLPLSGTSAHTAHSSCTGTGEEGTIPGRKEPLGTQVPTSCKPRADQVAGVLPAPAQTEEAPEQKGGQTPRPEHWFYYHTSCQVELRQILI